MRLGLNRLGFSSGRSGASGDVEPTLSQLRAGGSQSHAADGVEAVAASRTHFVQRFKMVVGSDSNAIVFNLPNYWQDTTAESAAGNTLTYNLMYAKLNGAGSWVQILVGGSPSVTIADGDHDTLTDALFPSDFGVAQFNQDDVIEIKSNFNVPAAGNRIRSGGLYEIWATDFQIAAYDPAGTTPTAPNVDGDFTNASGAALTNLAYLTPIIMLCRPLSYSQPFPFFTGTSMYTTYGDGGSNSYWGKGAAQRTSHDQTASSTNATPGGAPPYVNQIPCLNFCKGGSDSRLQINGTRWQWYMQFANVFIYEPSTNNLANYANNTLQLAAEESVVTEARNTTDSNIEYVIKVDPATIISSTTDDYATAAGQTPTANFVSGGRAQQLRASWVAHLESGFIDGLVYPYGVLEPNYPDDVFKADGVTPKLVNFDSVHYNQRGHEAMAENTRAQIAGVFTAVPFIVRGYEPTISLTGNTFTISPGVYGNQPTSRTYKWYEDGVEISGATSTTYVRNFFQQGKTITGGETPVNASGAGAEVITAGYTNTALTSTGLVALYGANYNSSTGNAPDATGISGNATQGTSANRPSTATVEQLTVMDFDGAADPNQDFLTLPNSLEALAVADHTVMVAFKTDTPTAGQSVLGSNPNRWHIELANDRLYIRVGDGFYQLTGITITSNVHIVTLISASGANACKVAFDTTSGTFTRGASGITDLYVGKNNGAFSNYNGTILGLAIWDNDLTGGQETDSYACFEAFFRP